MRSPTDLQHTAEAPGLGPDTPIVHMFTSGTTGKPKAVVHRSRARGGVAGVRQLGIAPGENYWCGADPGWAYGLYALIVGPLAAGIPAIFTCGTFNPANTWRFSTSSRSPTSRRHRPPTGRFARRTHLSTSRTYAGCPAPENRSRPTSASGPVPGSASRSTITSARPSWA